MEKQLIPFPAFRRGSEYWQHLSGWFWLLIWGSIALYFTQKTVNDFWHHYQIQTQGRPITVLVQRTERQRIGKSTFKNRTCWYQYRAVFQADQRERMVPISKAEYEHLKSGDSIRVLYHKPLNDFLAADDAYDQRHLITPGVCWVILAVLRLRQLRLRHRR